MKQNLVGWVEIPVNDMDRAINFYEALFQVNIDKREFGDVLMGWFPFVDEHPGSGAALIHHTEWYTPNFKEGVLVYLNCEDVAIQLEKVVALGGRILKEKTLISDDIGYMGLIHDSEGNRIGLFSKA